jgi:O-antigen/teichoic acid export membrane protein
MENLGATIAGIIVNVVVGLYATKTTVRILGVEAAGLVASAFGLSLVVSRMGTGICGAAALNLTNCIQLGDFPRARREFSNSVFVVAMLGVVMCLTILAYNAVIAGPNNAQGLTFTTQVLLSTVIAAIAGLYALGAFLKQDLKSREFVNWEGKLVFALVLSFLWEVPEAGLTIVGAAYLAGAIWTGVRQRAILSKSFPAIYLNLECLSLKSAVRIGWQAIGVLSIFAGGWILRIAGLVVLGVLDAPLVLGFFGIAFQVGNIAGQILNSCDSVLMPAIYRHTADGARTEAIRITRSATIVTLFIGGSLALNAIIWTPIVMSLWIGREDPLLCELVVLQVAAVGALASNSVFGTYVTGIGLTKRLGALLGAEGVIIILAALAGLNETGPQGNIRMVLIATSVVGLLNSGFLLQLLYKEQVFLRRHSFLLCLIVFTVPIGLIEMAPRFVSACQAERWTATIIANLGLALFAWAFLMAEFRDILANSKRV